MSAILHRRTVNIAITAEEAGVEFARSSNDVQAAFLLGMIKEIESWGISQSVANTLGFAPQSRVRRQAWANECRMTANEVPKEYRIRVSKALATLAEHLRSDPFTPTNQDDLLPRLRTQAYQEETDGQLIEDAADEIERLRHLSGTMNSIAVGHGLRKLELEDESKKTQELLECHRRFHKAVGCAGRPECPVCAAEEFADEYQS